jgi:hypothetical protein
MSAVPAPHAATLQTAYRDPEIYVLRWHQEGMPYSLFHFLALALNAVAGTLAYGALLGWGQPPQRLAECAALNTLASLVAWLAPQPALYILGSLSGLRLRMSTLFLASLTTAAWGGMALLSMWPIAAVFLLWYPQSQLLALFIHAVTLIFVGSSMACIFGRVIEQIEPGQGGGRVWWLILFVLLKVQLLYSFGVLNWTW